MGKRNLKLNSLPRYSKNSSDLILEEHGHCEVPAGCGGVVLRWRNPSQGMPLQTWVYTAGKCEVTLDGEVLTSARPIVPWGHRVWTLKISDIVSQYAVVLFAAFHDEKESRIKATGPPVAPVSILSKPDASWKYTLSVPLGDDWRKPDFDDSHWQTLGPKEINPADLDKTSHDSYRIRKLQDFGAEALGILESGTELWIRKAFSLERQPGAR